MSEQSQHMDPTKVRQPNPTDTDETRILKLLEKDMLPSEKLKKTFEEVRKNQKDFFLNSSKEIETGEEKKVRELYKENIEELVDLLGAEIVSGENWLQGLKTEDTSVIVVTNHLGIGKLSRIEFDEGVFPIKYIEPFNVRHYAFFVVSEELGASLHETALELPGDLRKIQEASGVVTIPVSGEGRTKTLERKVNKITSEKRSLFVMYPEGGTSGKRNNGGPYDLDKFYPGSFFVGAELKLPILPVCQVYNPDKGMQLYVLEPVKLTEVDPLKVRDITEMVKNNMQNLLTSLKKDK